MNRRSFLKRTSGSLAALTAASFFPNIAFAADKPIRVGLIGTGWYGKTTLLRALQVAPVEVVSLCDPDERLLEEAADLVASRQPSRKRPRIYSHFREMIAERDVEVMIISTPDHWHALPAIEAMQAGMDVYSEKPTGVDVIESQAMLAAARKYNRIVQINTQRRSTAHLIEARDEIIGSGKLGRIHNVETGVWWHMRNRTTKEAAPDIPPPEYLDYDLWTGPAPLRPYNRIIHPGGWRGFMEYGNGIVGDMCVHMYDTVRWMLDLGWPQRITSWGGILVDREARANITDTQTVLFEHDDFNVTWDHRTWGRSPEPESDFQWFATIHGEHGVLKCGVFRYDWIPHATGKVERTRRALVEPEKYPEDETDRRDWRLELHVAAALRKHLRNFFEARERRGEMLPVADIKEGHISSSCCYLANLSLELGRTVAFDPDTHTVKDDPEANRLLARPYRSPWEHPDPDNV